MKWLFINGVPIVALILLTSCEDKAKQLFILSGQSNMVRLDPNISFIPYKVEISEE